MGWPSHISCVDPKYRARNRTPSIRTSRDVLLLTTADGAEPAALAPPLLDPASALPFFFLLPLVMGEKELSHPLSSP